MSCALRLLELTIRAILALCALGCAMDAVQYSAAALGYCSPPAHSLWSLANAYAVLAYWMGAYALGQRA